MKHGFVTFMSGTREHLQQWKHWLTLCTEGQGLIGRESWRWFFWMLMECYGWIFFKRVMQQLDNKCYVTLLQQLWGNVIAKCCAKSINGVLFHHNNAPAHKSAVNNSWQQLWVYWPPSVFYRSGTTGLAPVLTPEGASCWSTLNVQCHWWWNADHHEWHHGCCRGLLPHKTGHCRPAAGQCSPMGVSECSCGDLFPNNRWTVSWHMPFIWGLQIVLFFVFYMPVYIHKFKKTNFEYMYIDMSKVCLPFEIALGYLSHLHNYNTC